jgi:hypothetical protein
MQRSTHDHLMNFSRKRELLLPLGSETRRQDGRAQIFHTADYKLAGKVKGFRGIIKLSDVQER